MGQVLLLSVSSNDRPGILQSLTAVVNAHKARVLNSGEAVFGGASLLGMLIGATAPVAPLQKALCEFGRAHGATPQCVEIMAQAASELAVKEQERGQYVIAVLAPALTAEKLAVFCEAVIRGGLTIRHAERLSSRESLVGASGQGCVQFHVNGHKLGHDPLRSKFAELSHEHGMDIVLQEETEYRRHRRLIALDMDSTLIQAEIIDELAKMKGVGEEVSRVTEAAMRGELDFKQSFTRRLSLLRGLSESRVYELLDRVAITDGAERLIGTLKERGYKTAILSGGFTFFGRHLQAKLGIDHLHANELEIRDGVVTGNVVPPIMDGQRKAEMLQSIAHQEGIALDDAIAVGDGANDLPMLSLAGMGIAFRAKPLVRQKAQHAISTLGLDAILYLLGIRDVG